MSPQSPASGAWAWASLGGGRPKKNKLLLELDNPFFFFGAPPPREAQAQAPVAGD